MSTLAGALLFLLPAIIHAAEPPTAASPSATPERIQKLVVQLGNVEFYSRQQAEMELTRIGFDSLDALGEATESDDLEVTSRAGRLMQTIKSNWSVKDDPPEVRLLLRDYEPMEYNDRETRIKQLLQIDKSAGAGAVCRIIRFERSPLLSRWAAVWLIASQAGEETPVPEIAGTIRKALGESRRPAARWVLAWLRMKDDPQIVGGSWTKFVESEQASALRHSQDTAPEIIEHLVRFQIGWLRKLGRTDEAMAAVERLIDTQRDEPAALTGLLRWLIEQKDWASLRRVEKRFQAAITRAPALLYMVAEAQADRGDAAEAANTAGRAFRLNPEKVAESLETHLRMGWSLQLRGRSDWSRRELAYVLENTPPNSPLAVFTAHTLAESLHDMDEDRAAAEVLKKVADAYSNKSNEFVLPSWNGTGPFPLSAFRERMHYYFACHWKAQGDPVKQRESLVAALAADADDIDVLIAGYQLGDSPPDFRQKIRKMIEKELCSLREAIADNANNYGSATPCNNFAWLVGNTEGDLDEALRFSRLSIRLARGDAGGYYDTLARVYFAKGDFKAAVENQMRAIELSPHIRAIEKQLALFKKTADAKGVKYEKRSKAENGKTSPSSYMPGEEEPADQADPFGAVEEMPARGGGVF